jgi:beta-phosphoglucomutase-like phosphatase (HAD superfamily)
MTELPPAWAVVDIDGVLADVGHRVHHVERRPKDWDAFFAAAPHDPPLAEGLAAVAEQVSQGRRIAYVSGRPERCRADTIAWMELHGLPLAPLHLRRDDDRRPARETKLQIVRRLEREAPIAVVIDDDAAVVAAMRAAGYAVLHATWMGGGTDGVDSSPAQGALFEAQEVDGRT